MKEIVNFVSAFSFLGIKLSFVRMNVVQLIGINTKPQIQVSSRFGSKYTTIIQKKIQQLQLKKFIKALVT
ncbi:MAG: hypothetical protein V3T43_06245 [Nitrosomonadaceae bacterium]